MTVCAFWHMHWSSLNDNNDTMKTYIYIFLLAVTITSCSSTGETFKEASQQVLPATVEKNIPYGASNQQVYDLYLPAARSSTTTKTLIIIHGGSWIGGDKNDLNGFVTFAQNEFPDYAVINMNYRLANGSSIPAFPNQINDVDAVIKKMTDLKEKLQINGQFALMGFSAGAHLSTLYDYKYDPNNQVKAVINLVGPVDFTDSFYASNNGFQSFFKNLIDASVYPDINEAAVVLSPARQVNANSSPTINFYGDQDNLVALSQLKSLENALSNHDIPYESTIVSGGHGNWNKAQYEDVQSKIKKFLEIHF